MADPTINLTLALIDGIGGPGAPGPRFNCALAIFLSAPVNPKS
jgi:hypothetical protein